MSFYRSGYPKEKQEKNRRPGDKRKEQLMAKFAPELDCYCKELNWLSYPRLARTVSAIEKRPLDEVKRETKAELCKRYGNSSTDLLKWLNDGVSDQEVEWLKEDRGILDPSCKKYYKPDPEYKGEIVSQDFDMLDVRDPLSNDVLRDFVRIQQEDRQLFNWDSLKELKGRYHPIRGSSSPLLPYKDVNTDFKTMQRILHILREQYGIDYKPQPQEKPAEKDFKWGQPVQYAEIPFSQPEQSPSTAWEDMSPDQKASALFDAVAQQDVGFVRFLLDAKADVHADHDRAIIAASEDRNFPLMELLMERGANPTAALRHAVFLNYPPVVTSLLEHKADINVIGAADVARLVSSEDWQTLAVLGYGLDSEPYYEGGES